MVTIIMEPVAASRPQVHFRGGKVFVHTTHKTRGAVSTMKAQIAAALTKEGIKAFSPHTPVRVLVTFYRTRPASIPKDETKPVRKPDLDNFVVGLLNSLVDYMGDDAQVTTLVAMKRWAGANEQARIEFEVLAD